MSRRAVVVQVALAALLFAGVAQASSGRGRTEPTELDAVASAQPSEHRRHDLDTVVSDVVVRGSGLKADVVATATTSCDGCGGEATALQVIHLPGPASARFDNVASAWTQGCWGCNASALAAQVIIIGPNTRVRPTNRSLAVNDACATCRTATAAYQLVVQVDAVAQLPDPARAEIAAWFAAESAALHGALVAPTSPRRARAAAARSLLRLRRTVVRAVDGRTRSARVAVTR